MCVYIWKIQILFSPARWWMKSFSLNFSPFVETQLILSMWQAVLTSCSLSCLGEMLPGAASSPAGAAACVAVLTEWQGAVSGWWTHLGPNKAVWWQLPMSWVSCLQKSRVLISSRLKLCWKECNSWLLRRIWCCIDSIKKEFIQHSGYNAGSLSIPCIGRLQA